MKFATSGGLGERDEEKELCKSDCERDTTMSDRPYLPGDGSCAMFGISYCTFPEDLDFSIGLMSGTKKPNLCFVEGIRT
jgi:hypothetical protein